MNNKEIIMDNQMRTNIDFTRPQSLNIGKHYLYRERSVNGKHQEPRIVTFVNYAPCPAIVIIKFSNGRVQRCLREDLFELENVTMYQKASLVLKPVYQQYFALIKINLANIYRIFKLKVSWGKPIV